MRTARRAAALFLLAVLIFPVEAFACTLSKGESAVVTGSAEDGTLLLADGRTVKLAAIDMPQPAALPSVKSARTHVTLYYGGTRIDRYGRALALVALADGKFLQERLAADGLARVMPSADMRLCIADLLAAEAHARGARLGLWRDPVYGVRQADDLGGLAPLDGSYQLVEGVVKGVSNIRGRLYFNFGDDWRTDFTVTVAPADAKLFKAGAWGKLIGKNPQIVGAKVRVRGFLSRYNGPGMMVAVPEQIELLDRTMPEERKKAANGSGGRKVSAKTRRKSAKPGDAAE